MPFYLYLLMLPFLPTAFPQFMIISALRTKVFITSSNIFQEWCRFSWWNFFSLGYEWSHTKSYWIHLKITRKNHCLGKSLWYRKERKENSKVIIKKKYVLKKTNYYTLILLHKGHELISDHEAQLCEILFLMSVLVYFEKDRSGLLFGDLFWCYSRFIVSVRFGLFVYSF